MFWALLLSHLIADYPLQTDRMVLAKRQWPGLTVHVTIHLLVMLVLLGGSRVQAWPVLLFVAAAHFLIDSLKNWLARVRPAWVVGPYLGDQGLHLISLGLGAAWIGRVAAGAALPAPSAWYPLLAGLLLVTHVWTITERILVHNDVAYKVAVQAEFWPRMAVRALLFAGFYWLGQRASGTATLAVVPGLVWPYQAVRYRRRAMLTDVLVALAGALILLLGQ